MKFKAMFVIFLAFMFFLTFTNVFVKNTRAAEENEIYVDSSFKGVSDGSAERPYKSIQEAIDLANVNDTIYVFGGDYNENLTIDKRLKLWGSIEDGRSTIDILRDRRYTIRITADYVEMQDFSIYDNYSAKSSPIGALISIQSNNVVIQGNILGNTDSRGIYLNPLSSGCVISGNKINNTMDGLYIESSDTNDIVNNQIFNSTGEGIYIANSLNNRLHNNSFKHNFNSIVTTDCSNLNISNNTFNKTNTYCIKLTNCDNSLIKNNIFWGNPGDGLYLQSDDAIVFNNSFNFNKRGLSIQGSNSVIYNNTIENSSASGVYTYTTSNGNIFYLNNFENNSKSAWENGNNLWYDSMMLKGNYWSDYNNIDRDLNGIGDYHYLSGGVLDIYPLGYFLKPPKKPADEIPEDGEVGTLLKNTLEIYVEDSDSEYLNVYFYNGFDDTLLEGSRQNPVRNVKSGSRVSYSYTQAFNVTVAWYVVVNDSQLENKSDIFWFATRQSPPDNQPPVAEAGGPYTADENEPLILDASESVDPDGEIIFYRWNFGDGSSQILDEKPTHKYKRQGTYIATLTVIDNNGSAATDTVTVTINPSTNRRPNASISVASKGYYTSLPISFSSSGSSDPDGDLISYLWSFGDGNTSENANPTHTYSSPGTYVVTLTVSDWEFDITTTDSIEISNKPNDGSPGFEIISLLASIAIIIIIMKKKNR